MAVLSQFRLCSRNTVESRSSDLQSGHAHLVAGHAVSERQRPGFSCKSEGTVGVVGVYFVHTGARLALS